MKRPLVRHLSAKVIGTIVALYLVGSGIYLFSISFPSTKDGLLNLQIGQRLLLTDHQASSRSFKAASDSFATSSDQLRNAPFAAKAVSLLPPFRWQVRLLKATTSLALAGQEASTLSETFPTLVPKEQGNLDQFLQFSSGSYLTWSSTHQADIDQLEKNLNDADAQLQDIPSWIMLGQRDQLRQLQDQVHALNSGVTAAKNITAHVGQTLGSGDSGQHKSLVLFTDAGKSYPLGSDIVNAGIITGKAGIITDFKLFSGSFTLPAPSTGFFPEYAPHLASAYGADTVITLDSASVGKLLAATGPLALPQNKITVNSSTKASQLFSTPVLAELIPSLVNKLAILEPSKSLGAFSDSTQLQLVRMWSANQDLESDFQALLPRDLPTDANWVKVMSAATTRDVTLTQKELPVEEKLQQTLTVGGNAGSTDIYLPTQAESISSTGTLSVKTTETWKMVTVQAPGNVSYTLPLTAAYQNHFTYLRQAGIHSEKLSAFNFIGTVNQTLTLTK